MKIIKADRIIVGDGKKVLADGAIAINEDGIIEDIGELQELTMRYTNATIETKDGCTLMPGLIDMHVHIGYWHWRKDTAEIAGSLGEITLLAVNNMKEALSCGITTLRSVAEPHGLGKALRWGFHNGYIIGPRYYTCERSISITGGHSSAHLDSNIEANGPWEVRAAVRQNIKDGADWIKAMSSHRTHISEFSQEELNAIADETHTLGRKCCVHAATKPSIEYAINAGFDTIEHGAFMTQEYAKKAADKGTAWVPTAYIYMYAAQYLKEELEKKGVKPTKPELLQIKYFEDSVAAYENNFMRNYEQGIMIATGTDIVFSDRPKTPIADEMEAFCKLGLSPLETIKCATYNPAFILGMEKEFGTVAKGLYADLLVVDGNPLDDIKVMKNVKEVYKSGELMFECGGNKA